MENRPQTSGDRVEASLGRMEPPSFRELANLALRIHTLESQIYIDELTGVRNARAFQQDFENESENVLKHGTETLGLILFDVDGLKRTNDTYGHPKGDYLIQESARVITELVRSFARLNDPIYRIGGDEFAVLMPRFKIPTPAEKKIIKVGLRSRFKQAVEYKFANEEFPKEMHVGISYGFDLMRTEADHEPIDTMQTFRERVDLLLRLDKQQTYQTLQHQGIVIPKDDRIL